MDRPIPAFYCCYLLRSTVSRGSVYIGSTPNPVRRLRQHNGEAKGGAVRTSRPRLRPWEMTCIVTGFPSHIAALQFEWAWQNPHITTHIPPTSRISHATSKKRSGHPKRPRHTTTSLLSNLHLLLRVPTFARWPLELRFFSRDVHKAWLKWAGLASVPISDTINIIEDFEKPEEEEESGGEAKAKRVKLSHGIHGLEISFANQKLHVEKAQNIINFEREGTCSICHEELIHDEGVYAICPISSCESVTHLRCLSQHFLGGDEENLVPIAGTCPTCKSELRWVDVVRELSLRMRGQKEVEGLLRVRKVRNGKGAEVVVSEGEGEEDEDEDEDELTDEEMLVLGEEELRSLREDDGDRVGGDQWGEVEDSDSDSGASSMSTKSGRGKQLKKTASQKVIFEDSDWDDAEVIE